jgi:hypothetical protein
MRGHVALIKSNMASGLSKHMDVRRHFYCHEKVESRVVRVKSCAIENMLADVLT